MDESDISKSIKLLKIHKTMFLGGVNGGILMDHLMSLKHGLKFLGRFRRFSKNKDLKKCIRRLVSYVYYKLYLLTFLKKDKSLVRNLWITYADLRGEMKNIIMKPGTNEYDVIFPEIFTHGAAFSDTSLFLCEEIKKLVTSECKVDQITSMKNELEGIRQMLTTSLEPCFIYAKDVGRPLTVMEEEKKVFSTLTAVLERAMCLIYMSFVGKMDDKMIISLKNSLSDLIIKEAQIKKMYLILDTYSIGNLKSHISMSLKLLEWNRYCYRYTEIALDIEPTQIWVSLEDNLTSIEHGLQFLYAVVKISRDKDVKLRIQHLVPIVKQKLYSLSYNRNYENLVPYSIFSIQNDEDLDMKLDHAYHELREEITHNVALLFTGVNDLSVICDFLLEKIMEIVSSSCKANQIIPMMEKFREPRKLLTLLKYEIELLPFLDLKEEGKKIVATLTTFLGQATSVIDWILVQEIGEEVLSMLKYEFSNLFWRNDIREMCREVETKANINFFTDTFISLSLLDRQEEYLYHIGNINDAVLKDHLMSLKHGIEFLECLPRISSDMDLQWHVILLAGNVKRKLESLTSELGEESLKIDVNSAYEDLREEMKNLIINPSTVKYGELADLTEQIIINPAILSPKIFSLDCYYRRDIDFLLEMITTLVTSNCKADQITPLKKELQDLRKMLTSLKPLGLYVRDHERRSWFNDENIFISLLTKAASPVYLSIIGKMDTEMALLVKSNIETMVTETDIWEMYTVILNVVSSDKTHYLEDDLVLLENLITLLKSNVPCLNDACSNLYEVLRDIYNFLCDLYPNVFLRKLHLLHQSFQTILGHSIPVVCSCYLEHPEVDISVELNYILDLIKHIKTETLEIKLYYFPRVDDLGFLEMFSGYLDDLMKNQEISMKEEIHALHVEVDSLLSLAKVTSQEELNVTPWSDVINMAYQAEYIIDLNLASSSRDLGLISSLSKIIEQLKNSRPDVHRSTCLSAQDVGVPSTPQVLSTIVQFSGNDIVGLQEETRVISKCLLEGENKLSVISIVGMAGVGKTTLASILFKSSAVAHHFDILAWCTVSQSYTNGDLLFSILDQVDQVIASDKSHGSIFDDQELADHTHKERPEDEELAARLCRSLKRRRYLIVLDDIWDTMLWNYLKRYLPHGREGSRILITTRNHDLADQIGSQVNQLHPLSEENSWKLFQKKMLKKENLSDDLQNIAKEIVENCKGLPLSIVIISGILYDVERTKKKWDQIAESASSLVLSDSQGKCNAILELSYNHLPSHLRSCFLFLGSFPEDEEISVNHLINLWIGEGFVQDTKSDSAEEVAKKYVDDLIKKSLVIPAKERSQGGVKTFRLHDLIRDFCLVKAKEKHFFAMSIQGNHSRPLQDPRRLIINGSRWMIKFEVTDTCLSRLHFSCHSIRSMICFAVSEASEIEKRIGSCDLVLLKVLEVEYLMSKYFPDISSLVHLRYLALGLWDLEISVLPSSLSKLQNLQILILRSGVINNIEVIKVPDFIFDMVKLRHVHISQQASFQADGNRLENSSVLLGNLRSLSKARVSCGDSKWLSKLLGLQRLSCVFVEDVLEEDDDPEADYLVEEDNDLEKDDDDDDGDGDGDGEEEDVGGGGGGGDDDDDDDDGLEDNRLRMLNFNVLLTSLKVRNAANQKQRFTHTCQLPIGLRELNLSRFFFTSTDISKIGSVLPHLEVFKIYNCYVPSGYEWNVDDDDFPKLKVLKLRSLDISKWIGSEDSFPSLEQLCIEDCNHLDEIPLDFGYLPNLHLITLRGCAPSVEVSAREIEKQQHEEQNTEMRVCIYPGYEYHY